MKTEWEFLTKTLFDPGIFWVMVTALASIAVVIVAAVPLRSLANSRKTEVARRLREDFWTPRVRAMMFLVNHGLLEYEAGPLPLFSFARISGDPAEIWIKQTLGDRTVLSIFEIDDELLNPLQEVATLAFVGAFSSNDVYGLFGNAMKSINEDEEIQKHILDMRTRPGPGSATAWIEIERIVPILDRLDQRAMKRLAKHKSTVADPPSKKEVEQKT
jgi:hypothetical protein